MRLALKKGFSFGLTSGIITTLGLMVGLFSGTASQLAVLGGILTIAVADSMSDALGIHMSEETTNNNHSQVWAITIATFLTKLIFSLTFVIPVLLFDLSTAIFVSIIWGLFALIVINYKLAKSKKENPVRLILEHLSIAILVIVATYLIGIWTSRMF
jgi:VIT1/CCC1 family predicted Fe2+/Mn2+ transporter